MENEEKKVDYSLPVNQNMFDMCHCAANCSHPCGRKNYPNGEKYFTVSDFSQICSNYKNGQEEH